MPKRTTLEPAARIFLSICHRQPRFVLGHGSSGLICVVLPAGKPASDQKILEIFTRHVGATGQQILFDPSRQRVLLLAWVEPDSFSSFANRRSCQRISSNSWWLRASGIQAPSVSGRWGDPSRPRKPRESRGGLEKILEAVSHIGVPRYLERQPCGKLQMSFRGVSRDKVRRKTQRALERLRLLHPAAEYYSCLEYAHSGDLTVSLVFTGLPWIRDAVCASPKEAPVKPFRVANRSAPERRPYRRRSVPS